MEFSSIPTKFSLESLYLTQLLKIGNVNQNIFFLNNFHFNRRLYLSNSLEVSEVYIRFFFFFFLVILQANIICAKIYMSAKE